MSESSPVDIRSPPTSPNDEEERPVLRSPQIGPCAPSIHSPCSDCSPPLDPLARVRDELLMLRQQQFDVRSELAELYARARVLEAEAAGIDKNVEEAAERERRLELTQEEHNSYLLQWCAYPKRLAKWREIGKAKLRTLRRSFDEYVRLANKPSAWDGIIAKDIPRTLSGISLPGDGDTTTEECIGQILRAWVARSEDEGFGCGYVQSMNFVTAVPCVLLAGSPDVAFGLCCAALEDGTLPETYSSWPPLAGLMAGHELLAEEIERRLPKLHAALGSCVEGLMGLVLPRWLMTCFAGAVPGGVLVRIWDDMLAAVNTSLPTLSRTGSDTPRTARTYGGACVVCVKWSVALLAWLEDRVVTALAELGPHDAPPDVAAFSVIQAGMAELPADWTPQDTGPWDAQRTKRRHSELLMRLRADVGHQRLSHAVAMDQEALNALRAEFENLRGSTREQGRWVDVELTPFDGASDMGLIFAPGSTVVLAVNRAATTAAGYKRKPVPPLTGWHLRAVDGAALSPGADLGQSWVEWKANRWEWESTRTGSFEPFGAADTFALEENWESGRGRFTTRGLSFNSRERALYTYDFGRMEEVAHDTGDRRTIRRTEVLAGDDWSRRQCDLGDVEAATVVCRFEASGECTAYENQMWAGSRGWATPPKSAAPPFSDVAGEPIERDDAEAPMACSWDGPWKVDRSVGGGTDGWLYAAKSFTDTFTEAPEGVVRRRRWVRVYSSIVPPAEIEEEQSSAGTTEESIDLVGLAPIFNRVIPKYDIELLPNLFRLLDVRHTGRIGSYALMVGVSMLEGGTVDAQLRLLHNLHDADADGHLHVDEAERLVGTLCAVANGRKEIGERGAALQPPPDLVRTLSDPSANGTPLDLSVSVLQNRSVDLGSSTFLSGTPRGAKRVPLPLQSGQTVVVTDQLDDLVEIWWVHWPSNDGGAIEMRRGYVREHDTVAAHEGEEGSDAMPSSHQDDPSVILQRLFATTADDVQRSLTADVWAQAASERVVWKALSEAGIPLGQQTSSLLARRRSAGNPGAAPVGFLSPSLSASAAPLRHNKSLPSPVQKGSPWAGRSRRHSVTSCDDSPAQPPRPSGRLARSCMSRENTSEVGTEDMATPRSTGFGFFTMLSGYASPATEASPDSSSLPRAGTSRVSRASRPPQPSTEPPKRRCSR
eukprot:TRINITY_DN18570_c0_g2_i1.p1 TRINITY_DN18570_c0_g2~~TRINITY_DN18570_c0_g2_i1.p1  ORF type:complete len:1167 (+),score=332.09 TRINITY_DN18570_c0_g2_i1:90-3590(+)